MSKPFNYQKNNSKYFELANECISPLFLSNNGIEEINKNYEEGVGQVSYIESSNMSIPNED